MKDLFVSEPEFLDVRPEEECTLCLFDRARHEAPNVESTPEMLVDLAWCGRAYWLDVPKVFDEYEDADAFFQALLALSCEVHRTGLSNHFLEEETETALVAHLWQHEDRLRKIVDQDDARRARREARASLRALVLATTEATDAKEVTIYTRLAAFRGRLVTRAIFREHIGQVLGSATFAREGSANAGMDGEHAYLVEAVTVLSGESLRDGARRGPASIKVDTVSRWHFTGETTTNA